MKSTFIRFVFFVLASAVILSAASPTFAAKEVKGGIESKIALETNLENRVKKVLTEITGTDQIIVIVNVQLASEQKEEKKAKDQEADFILPGVPIKEAISEKQVADSISAALGDDTRTLIKKMTATIIIDKGVSGSVEKVVQQVASGILGIDAERGDQLIIQKISFQRNPFYWGMLFVPPNIYWVLMVIAAVILSFGSILFLFGPFKVFSKDFAAGVMATAAALKENSKGEGEESFFKGGAAEAGPALDMRESQRSSFGGKEPPFAFINEDNIKALIFLIKGDTVDTIASIINYLPGELSSKILKELPADKQTQIGVFLSKVKELDPSEIDRLEAKIKNRIGFLSGGREKLTQLLDYSDDQYKDKLLANIRATDAALAEQIQKSLVTLNTLAELDVSSIQNVIKVVSPAIFAQVLKTMQEEAKEKILSTLPTGAAARLRQEIELAKPLTEQRLEAEKRRVVGVIRKMEERGLLTRTNG